jgi:hypothetical protein
MNIHDLSSALDHNESILRHTNREAGLTIPRALPMPWNELSREAREVSMWYVRNTLSYFDKAAIARHVIGCEILANEAAGVKPTITKERADELWAYVFSKQS